GPKGHYAIGHFLTACFSQIAESIPIAEFAQRWRPMIEFMLGQEWANARPWYYAQQLERHVLGFGMQDYLKRFPDHAALIRMMRDLYERWAKDRLGSDEDNLAGLCAFLASEVEKPLRIDGLQWIAEAMKVDSRVGQWYRDRTSNPFME